MHAFYNRISDRARRSLELANKLAYDNQHPLVTNLHIIWGLLEEGQNTASKVLIDMKVDLNQLKNQITDFLGKGDYTSHRQAVCYDLEARQSICEAISQGFIKIVGCHHLLFAIMANPYSLATRLLDQYKITPELVDAHIGAIVKR